MLYATFTSLLALRIVWLGGYMVPASRPFLANLILPAWPGPLPLLSRGVGGGHIQVHPTEFALGQIHIPDVLPVLIVHHLKPSNSNSFVTLQPRKVWPSSRPSAILLKSVTSEAPAFVCMP